MEISPLTLSILLVSSFLWGGIVGVINDINKMIRVFLCGEEVFDRYRKMAAFFRLEKKKRQFLKFNKVSFNVLLFVQDLFCVLIATLGLILLNYYYNDGYFRFFTFLAAVGGFAIYYFTFGKLVRAVSEPTLFFIRCIIIFVVRIVALPVRWIFIGIKNLATKFFVKYKKSIEKMRNLRYNEKRRKHIVRLSECGFTINEVKKV